MLAEEFLFEPEPTGGEREEEGIRDAHPVDDGKDRGPPEATRPRREKLMDFCCAREPESKVNLTVVHRRRECAQPVGAARALMEDGNCREFEEERSLVCLM